MKNLFVLTFLFTCMCLSAQQANDCINAIVVCGNTNIATNVSGFGIQELDRSTNACELEEANSLWLSVTIATKGSLAFIIQPDNEDLVVDYDFYVFGPNNVCGSLDAPIRCNTTNPLQASLDSNTTGLADVETETTGGPGSAGNGFVSSIETNIGEQYYILIDRPVGNGGFNLEWTGTADFLPSPDVNQPKDIEVCVNETNTVLNITANEREITSNTTSKITYYLSYVDAFDNENQIANPDQFTYSGTATKIFVRVTNPNGCFEIVDFTIAPITFNVFPNLLSYALCDSNRDGTEAFDTPNIIADIEAFIDNKADFSVRLYPNETAANTNTDEITGTSYTSTSTTIVARVTSTIVSNCAVNYPITLGVIKDPYPASIALVQCDIDKDNSLDGITQLDLEQAFFEFPNATVSYYRSIEDRNSNNQIANPQNYTNTTPFNATIYYRAVFGICESTGEIAIEVNPTTISLNMISPVAICDDNSDDGIIESTFDLESIRQNNYAGLAIAFYESLEDVSLERNPLDRNYRTGSTILYVRLEKNNKCQGVEEIELLVNPLPEVNLEASYQFCTDGDPLIINAPSGFDGYSWFNIDQQEVLGAHQQISINQEGNYRLVVEIQYQNEENISICEASTDFLVTPSNRAIFEEIQVEEAFDSTHAVLIQTSGDGDYEYSIDGINYQNEPRFDRVLPGFYTVFAQDKNGCGISTEEISVIGFPKFFTPNGDGKNDTWQVIGANENFDNKSIYIYDRYGKLLKQFSTNALGWDGSMNGAPLPASDYWFKLSLDNGKEFRGHFTLKR